MADEQIDYQIRIEAANALRSLENITATAANLPEVIQAVEKSVQGLADKFGISFGAAQKEFQNTIMMAENLRETMEKMKAAGAEDLMSFSPYLLNLSTVVSPFGEMGDIAGWKAMLDARREASMLSKDEEKTAAAIAKEQNAQLVAEEKKAAERKRNLDLAQQEQMAAEKEAASIEKQISLYGQVARTASEAASYLRTFTGTEQGQSILTRFFGNYQQAQGVVQQINVVKSSILELSKATGTTFAQSAKVFQEQFSNIPGITQQTNRAVRELNSEFDKVPEKTGRAVRGIDAVRIALGAMVAMLVFQVIQAVQNAFREMINNIKEAELAIYNLINAERRLSQEGIDVTPKGLQQMIDDIQKLVPVLSKIQAEELVSRIATNVAPALHLTSEQIKQLAESIALLYIRNKALGKSFDEVEAQVTNAFLTGKVSQGINQLGVKISDQIVRDEALRLGLVKTEKEFNNLSGEVEAHVKSVAMLSVVYKNAQQDLGSIGEYMTTLDAQSTHASTAWSNFLTQIGLVFGPGLAKGLEMVAHALEVTTQLLKIMEPILKNIVVLTVAWVDTMRNLPQYFKLGGGKLFEENFLKNLENAKKAFAELSDAADTPTSSINALGEAVDNVDFDKFKQKIEDILTDTANARSDLQKKLNEKRADLDLEYQRKAADAEKDYLRKVEDINRDYERDLKNIKDKQRQQDVKDEEKYQLQLWELRMRYLMDLEDALHARDARQILRLQRQYAFDKEDLARKHALDTKNREEDQKAELKDARIKRDQRLADAKLEYQQKLVDQRTAKQRELDDLNVWYKREQADIELAQQRKLQTLIKGWIDEQKITETNARQVYAILLKYFGPGGMTDSLYQYMMQSLVANTQNAIASLGMVGNTSTTGGTTGSRSMSGRTGTARSGGGKNVRAEGGTMVATRPTSVTFGEAGAEAALFLPLNHIGRDSGKVDFSGNAGGGMDGRIVVRLDLSPDLEARVVENSLNGVAEVLTQINRSKMR